MTALTDPWLVARHDLAATSRVVRQLAQDHALPAPVRDLAAMVYLRLTELARALAVEAERLEGVT